MSSMKLSTAREDHRLPHVLVPPSDPLAVGRPLLPQLGQGLTLFPVSFVEVNSQSSGSFTSFFGVELCSGPWDGSYGCGIRWSLIDSELMRLFYVLYCPARLERTVSAPLKKFPSTISAGFF